MPQIELNPLFTRIAAPVMPEVNVMPMVKKVKLESIIAHHAYLTVAAVHCQEIYGRVRKKLHNMLICCFLGFGCILKP